MSAPIEARRLSGVDLGKTVTLVRRGTVRPVSGPLDYVTHQAGVVTLLIGPNQRYHVLLAPTDVVTLAGTTPSEEGS